MGKRGTKPQPTVLKLLRGNPGKRKLNENEPRPSGGLPEPPEHLNDKAREIWDRFAQELSSCGVGTNLDATALEMLCASYANYLDAAQKVAQGGAVWIAPADEKGLPSFCYSPYWAVMNREWKKVVSMLAEFGMTPSSRSSLSMDMPRRSTIPKRERA